MKIRNVMTAQPVSCDPLTSLSSVAMIMLDHDCASVPVVKDGRLAGIVTDRDIACRAVAHGWHAAELPAAAIMSSPLVALHPDETLEDAAQLMMENRVHHLPVIDEEGRLLGIVALSDVGRRLSNRRLGELARETSIRPTRVGRTREVQRLH